MSRIRGRGTRPERELAAQLRRLGLRPKEHYGVGRADFAFPRKKVAVFVDGCFWHGCPKHYRRPSSNQAYWDGKLAYNQKRDRERRRELRRAGWTVVRIWEHALPDDAGRYARMIARKSRSKGRPSVLGNHVRGALARNSKR